MRVAAILSSANFGFLVTEPTDGARCSPKVPTSDHEQLCVASSPDVNEKLCKYCNLFLIKHKSSYDEKTQHRRPEGISKSRCGAKKVLSSRGEKLENKQLVDSAVTEVGIGADCTKTHRRNVFKPRFLSLDEQAREFECDFQAGHALRSRTSGIDVTEIGTSPQALREVVFAELRSRNRYSRSSSVRFNKEGCPNDSTSSERRKLNRFSTNGCFISRLLESEAGCMEPNDSNSFAS